MQPSQLKTILDSLHPRLHQEILSCLTLLQANTGPWPSEACYEQTWNKLRTYTTSGKLRRGSLLLTAFQRTHGERVSLAYRLGAWLEILHSGFLIHDDIIDNDNLRRGQSSYHAYLTKMLLKKDRIDKTNHAQKGQGLGIAIGEYLICAAMSEIKFLDIPERIKPTLIARWDQTILDTMAGQIRDINSPLPDEITKADILETARLKTSGYSFSLPLFCSGLLSGLPLHLCDRLTQIGQYLGICLQLQDDEDGLLKQTSEIGKTTGTDLKDNTITLWRWHLDKQVDQLEKKILHQIYGNQNLSQEEIEFVRDLYYQYELDWITKIHQNRLLKKARKLIHNTEFPHFLKERLEALSTLEFVS